MQHIPFAVFYVESRWRQAWGRQFPSPEAAARGARTELANSEDGNMRRRSRIRRLNPYQPSADTGLLKVLGLIVAVILVVFSGALDCRFALIPLGIC